MSSISLHHIDSSTYTRALGAAFPSIHFARKTYFAVEPGEQHAIRVNLDGYARFEVVCSLDGRDVLTNTPANFREQRGVVTSSGVIDFKGWRVSNSEVKAFIAETLGYGLTTSEKSGGAKSARGTIGVAIFREQPRPQPVYRPTSFHSYGGAMNKGIGGGFLGGGGSRGIGDDGSDDGLEAMSFGLESPAMRGGEERSRGVMRGGGEVTRRATPAPSVGTKAGHSISDSVGETTFIRAKDAFGNDEQPTLIEIEYDCLANLIARKIWPAPQEASKAWAGMTSPQFCDPRRL